MAVVKFLQLADLHLGKGFGWLPGEGAADRRHEQRRAVEAAVRTAVERGAHALLVPGDVFDAEAVDSETLAWAVHEAFALPGCPPVFIAPGNHDPCSDTSHYWNPALLRARGWAWPAHVHVFDSGDWTMRLLPGLEGVRIWGRCFVRGVPSAERPLAAERIGGVTRGALDVAVFHGSREGSCPPAQKMVSPFSDVEILAAPFDYLAVGHYHAPSTFTLDDTVRMAYPGPPIALAECETGRHGVLEVRIRYGEGVPARAEVEPIELDRRQVFALHADVTGCTSVDQVDRRIGRAIDQAGASELDIVTVDMGGRLTRGVHWTAPGPELRRRVFHLRVTQRGVRPDYDLDALRASTGGSTEERFARTLLQQLDATTDATERAEIEGALYYGLDAFRLHEVTPAYEALEQPLPAAGGALGEGDAA